MRREGRLVGGGALRPLQRQLACKPRGLGLGTEEQPLEIFEHGTQQPPF